MATPFAQALGRILLKSRPGAASVLPTPRTRAMFPIPQAPASSGRVPSWMRGMPGIPSELQGAARVTPPVEPGVIPGTQPSRAATISGAARAMLGTRGRTPSPMPTGSRRDVLNYLIARNFSSAPTFGRPDIARTGALRAAGQQASRARGQVTPEMEGALEQFIQSSAGGLSPFLRARYAIRLAVKENDPTLLRNGQQLAKRFENVMDDAEIGIINDEIAAARKSLNIADDVDIPTGYQAQPEPEDLASLARGEPQFKWTRSTQLSTMNGIERANNLEELGEIYSWAMSSSIMDNPVWRKELLVGLQMRAEAIAKEQLRRRFLRDVTSIAEQKGARSIADVSTADFTSAVDETVDLFYSVKGIAAAQKGVNLLPQTVKGVYNQTNFMNAIRTSFDNAELAKVLDRLKKIAAIVPEQDKALLNAAFQRQNNMIQRGFFKQANDYMEREAALDLQKLDTTVKRIIQLKDAKIQRDYSPLRTRSKGVRPAYGDTAAYVEGQLSAPTSTWRGKEGDVTVDQWIGSNRAGKWEDFMRDKTSYVSRSGRVQEADPYILSESAAPVREVIAAARKAGDEESMQLVRELSQRNADELVRVPPQLLSRMSAEQRSVLVQRRVPIGYREAGLSRPYIVGETGDEVLLPNSPWLRDIAGADRAKKLAAAIDPKGDWFSRPIPQPDPRLGLTRQEWVDRFGYSNLARIRGATTVKDADRALALVQAAKAAGLVDEGFWRLTAMEYGVKVKSLLGRPSTTRQGRSNRYIKKKSGVFVRQPRLREVFTDMQEMLDHIGPLFSIRVAG